MTDRTTNQATRPSLIDWIALWIFAFGIWPLADPGHHGDTALSLLDLALHAAALGMLISRWKWQLVPRGAGS